MIVEVTAVAKYGPDVVNLFRKLLLGHRLYFSHDIMNTEGRKVFEEAARMLIHEHPEMKPAVTRVRRNPTLENALRLASRILGEAEAKELLLAGVEGPYRTSMDLLIAEPRKAEEA